MEIISEKIIGQGNTAEIYKLDDNKILKLFRNGINKCAVEREYQNSISVQKILNCIPKVYEMVEMNGRYGIVFQEIKGTDMLKTILVSLWKINDYSKTLAHYHLSIQKTMDDTMWLVKEKLEQDLDSADVLPEQYKEIVRKYLKQLPDGNVLCHFDFHPGNVMIRDNESVILDWMTACRGDACADVARTCILLKYGEVPHAPWIMRKLISIFQQHIYKVYIKEYLTISKRSIKDINMWELPVAAARLGEWLSESEKQVLIQLVKVRCNEIDKSLI